MMRRMTWPTFTLASLLISVLAGAGCASNGPRQTPGPQRLVVAAVSMESELRQPERNLDKVEAWARKAAAAGAQLVLFPETTLSGWWASREIRAFGEPVDGPSIQRLVQLARELQVTIGVGMTEREGDRAYITHVLLDGRGIIGRHRKSELPSGEEKIWDCGNDKNVFEVNGICVGIAICYESVKPATCAALKAAGARIILAPYANATDPAELLDGRRTYPAARARENGVWYVACDEPARDDAGLHRGAVYVINPAGEVVAITSDRETGENMLVYEIKL